METRKNPPDATPVITRTAFAMGASVRFLVNAITYPYHALSGLSLKRRKRLGPGGPAARTLSAGQAALRRARERTRQYARRKRPAEIPQDDIQVPLEAARIATRDGLHKLSAALASPSAEVRARAVETVGEFGPDRAAPIISAVLQDPDAAVRRAAAAAAASTRASAAVFSLILALDDPTVEVRREVKLAIETITGEELDLDPASEGARLQANIERLKDWWKQRRLAQLVTRVDEVSTP
jgi:hypothetical protein